MNIKELYKIYTQDYLVDTDTRTIRKNTIFFALKGANFNGNKFAKKAIELGAKYAVIDEKEYESEKCILVNSALETLQILANYHRNQSKIPFIGLTGSNGKTTTKELIYSVLSQKYNAVATKGNLNNHIGVPLTLLSIKPTHEIAIIEMGANHQKEIEFLSSLSEPDYGYITNFGKAHLEGFGGVEGVIKGKSELYSYLESNNKTAVVNPNDEIQVEKTKIIKRISLNIEDTNLIQVKPFLELSYKNQEIKTHLIGKYNYNNILAAITFGEIFNVSEYQIKKALENYIPKNNRSQIIKKGDKSIILDAYNANPSSMKAALENFSSLNKENKLIILGDMFELGEESEKEHQAIVDLASKLQFDCRILIGENFYKTKTDFLKFNSFKDFSKYLQPKLIPQKSILIKGSRGMQLERVLDFIS